MPKTDPALARLQRASQRVRRAQERIDNAREELHVEILAARMAGVSLSAIARTVGVSRQRMQQLIERLERD